MRETGFLELLYCVFLWEFLMCCLWRRWTNEGEKRATDRGFFGENFWWGFSMEFLMRFFWCGVFLFSMRVLLAEENGRGEEREREDKPWEGFSWRLSYVCQRFFVWGDAVKAVVERWRGRLRVVVRGKGVFFLGIFLVWVFGFFRVCSSEWRRRGEGDWIGMTVHEWVVSSSWLEWWVAWLLIGLSGEFLERD